MPRFLNHAAGHDNADAHARRRRDACRVLLVATFIGIALPFAAALLAIGIVRLGFLISDGWVR
jgi:hypothetical protein